MNTYLDCIPCILRQTLAAVRISSGEEAIHRQVLNAVARMIPDLPLTVTPPEIAQRAYRIVHEMTGNVDPYGEAKKKANSSALSQYNRMKDMLAYSNDPLKTACKLAIAGNAVDVGANTEVSSIYSIVEDSIGFRLDQKHYRQFQASLMQSDLIVYMADNAGEIVFDRILIEQLLQIKKMKIIFVVRDKPIINDATWDDALQVGLNKIVTIISSGSDAPATVLSQCSAEMRGYYQAADLIISKGQGNYKSLSDRTEDIFFLFKVKCAVIARDSGYGIDSPVLMSTLRVNKVEPETGFWANPEHEAPHHQRTGG